MGRFGSSFSKGAGVDKVDRFIYRIVLKEDKDEKYYYSIGKRPYGYYW